MSDSDSDISFTCFAANDEPIPMGSSSSTTDGSSCTNSSSSTFSDAIENNNHIDTNIFEFVPSIIDAGVAVSRAALAACEEYTTMLDEKEEASKKVWGGSMKGKAPNKKRDFEKSYNNLVRDYFNEQDSVYNEVDFERRFRISRSIFHEVYNTILGKGMFVQRKDALGKSGIHPLVRVVACMRHLAYGDAFDGGDEYFRLSESSISESVKAFTHLVKLNFGERYLNRCPTEQEKNKMLQFNKKRGFPGMFASWDCSHFKWEKCPI
jgi:hypothetical protein